ncbi:MAG TPA: TonB-dependent receptor [Bryobacteraceae bacterium]|nr:TonB-dependent receptor [Bryobacteraceae bacterium]
MIVASYFSRLVWSAALVSVAALPFQSAQAQILYGGLVGNVTDSSGAAIPNANVKISHLESGATREAKTSETGAFRFATIPPGTYAVTTQAQGFRAFSRSGVEVSINNLTRVDVRLEIGELNEQVTVEGSSVTLQTDRAEVRHEVSKATLENVPIPVGRNYQMLLGTLPGFTPPQNAHSAPANPTRSVRYSVNGTSDMNNNVRIDGTTAYNPNLPHMTGINPTLDAIEVVNVVTNSFDAEQGLAGGAAVNVQIKSGTNTFHGSAFLHHFDQKLSAYPYFSNRSADQPKYIYNQAGGTFGGPIVKNKVFFFVSYERTSERQNAQSFVDVPTAAMRAGDLSASPTVIYDPMSGAPFNPANPGAYGRDRTAFPENRIPRSRFSGPTNKILQLPDWPLPNSRGEGALGINLNYLAAINYVYDRDQIDAKTNFNLTKNWTAFTRLSYLNYGTDNPAPFGILAGPAVHPTDTRPGKGFGGTYSGTVSSTYVVSPTLVFDGYFGAMLLDTNALFPDLDRNIARDVLGIPGANGDTTFAGGMVRMPIDGFALLGNSNNSPFFGRDYQYQYVANGNSVKGSHDVRFGGDMYRLVLNQGVANAAGAVGGPAGGFLFRNSTTTLAGGPAANDYNSIASFLLGTAREAGRNVLSVPEYNVRSMFYSLYVRDRWQVTPRLTVSYGVRWEYYPTPTRRDRGLERYDFNTNESILCGLGSTPRNCGFSQSRKLFAPRVGIAWRAPHQLVVRAGYGITYDPFSLGRDLRANYPVQFVQNLAFDTTLSYSTTLDRGLPSSPIVPEKERLPLPLTAAFITADDNFKRGYVQSWNLTLEKQIGKWVGSAGYVATRSIRQIAFLDANWSDLGKGNAGQQLVRRFGRNAATTFLGHLGTVKYDSLQTRLQRSFRGGFQMQGSYTWAHSLGYTAENSVSSPRVNHPAYWDKNYGPTPLDIRHNLVVSAVVELPFGRGKRWVQQGVASAVLGDWQINALSRLSTGTPVTPVAPNTTLNAPGSAQFADCLGPIAKVGSRTQWWDRTNLANPNAVSPNVPRFGSCGVGVLRGPGLINVDMGIFRRIRITERVSLQVRGEAFNVSNTPHFANPNADVSSGNFGLVGDVQNTGREGNDQRFFRIGVRIGF